MPLRLVRGARWWTLVFLLPALGLYTLLVLYPIGAGVYNSFTEWTGFGRVQEWTGLANYRELLADPLFWGSFRNSFFFMVMNVPARLAFALLLAVILNSSRLRGRAFFRTAIFLPVVTTTAIVGVLMTFVFNPFNGPVNLGLLRLDLIERPVDFLGDPSTALPTIVVVSIWKWTGVTLIYWLAALQSVPQSLTDAARVDGASRWQQFRHVTAPLILPFAVVIFLISMINMLQVFDLVQTMTGGGPFFTTEVVEIFIFRHGFTASQGVPRLGYASAAAVFFGIVVLGLSLVYGLVLRKTNQRRRELAG